MDYSNFGPLDTRVSVLGFGCAPMGSRYGRRESLRALGVAFDLGVNYFDTARAYGYGDAEAILGQFVRDKRDRVVVATKFGIDPPNSSAARRLAKFVARKVFRVVPELRARARHSLGRQFSRPLFDRALMTHSVETSLRQLNTDRIDVLLFHDCTPEAMADDDVFRGLEALVASGKVRCVGASGDRTVVSEALRRRPALRVAQSRRDFFRAPADWINTPTGFASIAYNPFGGEMGIARLREILHCVVLDATAPSELRRRMRDARVDDALAELALSSMWGPGGADVVLTTMFTRRHIEANVRASHSTPLSASDIAYLRGLLTTVPSKRL